MFNRDKKRKSRMGISQFRRLNVGTAFQALAVATVLLFAATNAHADYLDLLAVGNSGVINGALYTQGSEGSGTGVFPAFTRQQAPGNDTTSEGYNTNAGILDNVAGHQDSVMLSELGQTTVLINGVSTAVYQFRLDINEAGGVNPANQYLSLDELQIRTGTVENPTTTDISTLGTLRYNMDGAGDKGVLLDFQLATGSGTSDMILSVPVTFFAGALQSDFVYLYSKFGVLGTGTPTCVATQTVDNHPGCHVTNANYGSSDGFEEWAYRAGGTVIPEPSTYALYALGASMLFLSGWWQKRRKATPTA